MSTQKVINWTAPMLQRFKVEYAQAVAAGADTFVFDGNEFVVSYAKYLIEYLNGLFKPKDPLNGHQNN